MGIRVYSTVAVVLLALSQTAGAGGFYISTIGSPGSVGTAGAANPTNTFTPMPPGPIRQP